MASILCCDCHNEIGGACHTPDEHVAAFRAARVRDTNGSWKLCCQDCAELARSRGEETQGLKPVPKVVTAEWRTYGIGFCHWV